jgi:hypothetical protein
VTALAAAALLGIFGLGALASAATKHRAHRAESRNSATGLGQLSGLLPRNHLTLGSAIQVNLSNETVRLPLYKGDAPVPGDPSKTEPVWFVLSMPRTLAWRKI